MYYILNETDQIIAADDNLLTLCNVTNISELSSKVTLGDTTFTSQNEKNITIKTDDSEQTYSVSKTSLSSILGHMTLVVLDEAQENEDAITEDEKFEPLDLDEEVSYDISTDDSDDDLFISTDDSNDDLFEINEAVEEESIPEVENTIDEPDETFDLISESIENLDLDAISEEETKEDGEIIVDITNISQMMGISDEDYTLFLNEYIDTALELEEDLQSDNADTRSSAIMTLTDLSEIMHLPEISNIMGSINSSSPEQQKGYIGSLYTTLSRLTTQSSNNETVEMELFDSVEAPAKIKAPVVAKPNPNSFGTIDFSDVKAKHFDFQLEEAANDLSLPVELIEEFVHDFIEQGHIETKRMLEAYEEGDLAKIQAIGHLLKGASSNLRINALSDTLYKIQFCENENGLDDLIKDYWAHFLSFETQINVISN